MPTKKPTTPPAPTAPKAKPARPAKPAKPGMKPFDTVLTLVGIKQSILTLLKQGEDQHWQIGTLYNIAVAQKLAEAAGYKSPRDYFTLEVKPLSPATLSRYAAVAKTFSEDDAKTYGCTKLAELITYETLANTGAVSGDPGLVQVHVPQKDGSTQDKAFKDCSSDDLTRAIQAFKSGASPLPADAAAELAKLQAALTRGFGAHPAQLTAKAKGRGVVYDLTSIPADQLAMVLHALLDALA